MPLDLQDPNHAKRLRSAVDASLRKLRPFRDKRMELLRQFVGYHYPNGAEDRVPVNLIELLARVYSRKLAPSVPKALVTTAHRELKPYAYNLGLAIDYLVKDIDFGGTWTEAILDAIFGLAVVKVGLSGSQFLEIDGDEYQTGQVFACPVYLEDYVLDMTARRGRALAYEGNRYRIPLEKLKNDPRFDQRLTQDLEALDKRAPAAATDEESVSLSAGEDNGSDEDELEPHVELWDFWVPGQGVIATFLGDRGGSALANLPALRIQKWTGLSEGPYYKMGFGRVPGNVLPIPPAFQIADTHELVNILYRKLGRQAENQRDILTYPGGSEQDAEKATYAKDQQAVRMSNPSQLNVLSFGGINQPNLSYAMHMMSLAKGHAGNLDVLAGLASQTDTVGQDQMLGAAASELLEEMAETSKAFAAGVFRAFGFYLMNDPLIEIPLTKRVPGTRVEIQTTFTPSDMDGAFLDYNFEILPHSIRSDTPRAKLSRIQEVLDRYIIPNQEILAQQGIVVTYESLVRLFADYLGVPELEHVLMFYGEPQEQARRPVQPGGGGRSPAAKPQDRRVRSEQFAPGMNPEIQSIMSAGAKSNGSQSVLSGGRK